MEPPDRRRKLKILNVEKEPSLEAQIPGGPGMESEELSREQIKKSRECLYSMFYKLGLPFAILSDYVVHVRQKEVGPGTLPKRAFHFCLNMLAGAILGTPLCFFKLIDTLQNIERKKKEDYRAYRQGISEMKQTQEEPQTAPQTEELAFPIGTIDITLNEPEGAYASDFESSSTEKQEEKQKKTHSTTYDELRAIHRSRYAKARGLLSAEKFESSHSTLSSTPTSSENTPKSSENPPTSSENPPSTPPPRKVTLNKYGDEIE